MSAFDRLLNTTVTIWRTSDAEQPDSEGDDYGHPDQDRTPIATVAARIEPKAQPMGRIGSPQEPTSTWEGTIINDFYVYCRPTDVAATDSLTDAAGNEYKIIQVRNAAGHGHHLEIDCRRIVPDSADGS